MCDEKERPLLTILTTITSEEKEAVIFVNELSMNDDQRIMWYRYQTFTESQKNLVQEEMAWKVENQCWTVQEYELLKTLLDKKSWSSSENQCWTLHLDNKSCSRSSTPKRQSLLLMAHQETLNFSLPSLPPPSSVSRTSPVSALTPKRRSKRGSIGSETQD